MHKKKEKYKFLCYGSLGKILLKRVSFLAYKRIDRVGNDSQIFIENGNPESCNQTENVDNIRYSLKRKRDSLTQMINQQNKRLVHV